uniref:Uncharacterized protein n=1 Tax=Arundo donax TaxID=35708 RepID=A0A0A8YB68_ARUDO
MKKEGPIMQPKINRLLIPLLTTCGTTWTATSGNRYLIESYRT